MLTEYEAATLAKQRAADAPLVREPLARNRIGAVLLVLSVLAAAGLLYSAFFTDRGHAARPIRAGSAPAGATLVLHPATSGLAEAALFLRHRPFEGDDQLSQTMTTAADIAAPVR
jgi:hypothetical protein